MSSQQSPPAPPRRRSPLLIASLALNLRILGTIGGTVLAHRVAGGGLHDELNVGRMVGTEQGLRGFVRTLPKERRAVFRADAEVFRQNVRPLRQAARQTRTEAALALRAEPFDAARFEKAMGEMIAAEGMARKAAVSVLAQAVAKMTADERAGFLAWRRKFERAGPPPPPNAHDSEQPGPPLPPKPR